jgi:hypothetical protein
VTTLLSIDGGNAKKNVHACYVAEFEAGHLYALHELNREQAVAARMAPDAVAVERPSFDGRIMRGVPPGVIIDLAWNTARVAEALAGGCPVHEYPPGAWIGTTAKPVLHVRIWRALKPEERKFFHVTTAAEIERAAEHYARKRKVLQHVSFNTLDAAGVGLFHLGRIGKGGTRR